MKPWSISKETLSYLAPFCNQLAACKQSSRWGLCSCVLCFYIAFTEVPPQLVWTQNKVAMEYMNP